MKIVYLFIAIIIISNTVKAEEWVSPIDIKYRSKNQELYSKLNEARIILDSWSGQQEKLIKANQLLTEIIKTDNEYAPAHKELARLYMKAGYINSFNLEPESLPPSEKEIFRSIQIEPNYADSYLLLGNLYTFMKRYDDAKTALKKADTIGTKDPWRHLFWARLLSELGDQEASFKRYLEVINEGTDNKNAYKAALGGVINYYMNKGDNDKADEWFRKKLSYEPEEAWGWGNYAVFLLYDRNDIEGAILNAEKALSIMDYDMGRFTLACALYTKWALMM